MPAPGIVFIGGLASFGFACGVIGGLSVTPGTSQALLTGALGFVAGGVLGFAGFRPQEKAPVDLRQAGLSLAAFSVALLVGIAGGVIVREVDPIGRILGPRALPAAPTCPSTSSPATESSPSVGGFDESRTGLPAAWPPDGGE